MAGTGVSMEDETFLFHNHEGRELTAYLDGEPGNRRVLFFDYHLRFIGERTYRELMREDCDPLFALRGDVQAARDEDLILLDANLMQDLAVWAEELVLGPAAIGEEA